MLAIVLRYRVGFAGAVTTPIATLSTVVLDRSAALLDKQTVREAAMSAWIVPRMRDLGALISRRPTAVD
ncbi:MAG TPA: hypothetical protein VGJ13_07735 [Pseudonocardiaceae bacterium]|jgi:hypothetical protein